MNFPFLLNFLFPAPYCTPMFIMLLHMRTYANASPYDTIWPLTNKTLKNKKYILERERCEYCENASPNYSIFMYGTVPSFGPHFSDGPYTFTSFALPSKFAHQFSQKLRSNLSSQIWMWVSNPLSHLLVTTTK